MNRLLIVFAILIPWQVFFEIYDPIDLPLTVFMIVLGICATLFKSRARAVNLTRTVLATSPLSAYLLMLAAIAFSSVLNSTFDSREACIFLRMYSGGLALDCS
jgi:hypothetical protein